MAQWRHHAPLALGAIAAVIALWAAAAELPRGDAYSQSALSPALPSAPKRALHGGATSPAPSEAKHRDSEAEREDAKASDAADGKSAKGRHHAAEKGDRSEGERAAEKGDTPKGQEPKGHEPQGHEPKGEAETGHAAAGEEPSHAPPGHDAHEGHEVHSGHQLHGGHLMHPAHGRRDAPEWSAAQVWEEEEEHHHVTQRDYAVACLLFGALGFDMLVLHMVNWRDPHVRSYIHKMISATVSIFLGVLLNQAIYVIFIAQLLPAPWPRGLGIKVGHRAQLAVGFILFTGSFSLLNVFAYLCRDSKRHLHAVSVLGGHIMAFAGITMFGNLQVMLYPRLQFVSCAIPIALVTLLVYCTAAKMIRTRCFGEFEYTVERVYSNSPAGMYHKVPTLPTNEVVHVAEESEWREGVCEAEDDAAVLILSFLSSQAFILWLTDELLPLEGVGDVRPGVKVLKITLVALGFVVLLTITTFWRSMIPTTTELGHIHDPTSFYMRSVRGLQNFWGMSMSWCLLRAGEWELHGSMTDHSLLRLVNAIAMTGMSVIAILALDKLADWLRPQEDRKKQFRNLNSTTNADKVGKHGFHRSADMVFGTIHSDAHQESPSTGMPLIDRVTTMHSTLQEQLDALHDVTMNLSNLERAVRTIIGSLGLLVGMCWEKAFDSSDETIIHGSEVLHEHQVIAKILMAFVTTLLVLPAWLRFIAPSANKHWREHLQIMQMEDIQAGKATETSSLAHFISIAKGLSDDELAVALRDLLERRVEVKAVVIDAEVARLGGYG